MDKRSEFDEYLFGGGLEADANKGVAKAIADLKAAGIEPAYGSTRTQTVPQQTETLQWLETINRNCVRMATDEAYRLEISKKLS